LADSNSAHPSSVLNLFRSSLSINRLRFRVSHSYSRTVGLYFRLRRRLMSSAVAARPILQRSQSFASFFVGSCRVCGRPVVHRSLAPLITNNHNGVRVRLTVSLLSALALLFGKCDLLSLLSGLWRCISYMLRGFGKIGLSGRSGRSRSSNGRVSRGNGFRGKIHTPGGRECSHIGIAVRIRREDCARIAQGIMGGRRKVLLSEVFSMARDYDFDELLTHSWVNLSQQGSQKT
jgi:hypothetical protein